MSWLSNIIGRASARSAPQDRREPALAGWSRPANEPWPRLPESPAATATSPAAAVEPGASAARLPNHPERPVVPAVTAEPAAARGHVRGESEAGQGRGQPAPVSRETARPLPQIVPHNPQMTPALPVPAPRADRIRLGRRTPDTYAEALRDFIRAHLQPGERGMILVANMPEIYEAACAWKGWTVRPWTPVGADFRAITTGDKKPYVDVDETGFNFYRTGVSKSCHRRRVYYVEAAEMFGAPNPPTPILTLARMACVAGSPAAGLMARRAEEFAALGGAEDASSRINEADARALSRRAA